MAEHTEATAATGRARARPRWRHAELGWAWLATLPLLLVGGERWEPLVAAAGVLVAGVRWARLAPRAARPTTALLLYTVWLLLSLVLPRPGGPPTMLQLPDWAEAALAPGSSVRMHLAPWVGLRWVWRFAGFVGWFVALTPVRARSRRRLADLAGLWVTGVAAWVLTRRLSGAFVASANDVALLFALGAPLLAVRVRQGAWWWLGGLLFVLLAVVELRSWSATGLTVLGLLWVLAPRPAHPFLVMAVLLGVAGAWYAGAGEGVRIRLRLWRDLGPMWWDAFPWGFGPGAFRWVAPPYLDALPLAASRALHPESGYAWLWLGGGVPLMAVVAYLVATARRRGGTTAAAARVSWAILAVAALLTVPWLWGPSWWLLPLLAGLAWRWHDHGRA